MPSLPTQQQQYKKKDLPPIAPSAKNINDNTAVHNQQTTMGSIKALGSAGNPFHYVVQQPKEHLLYESFLDSVSNDIVQYLAMNKNNGNKASTATPSTPPNPKRRSGAKPDGIDRKRSKRNSSQP